MWSPVSNAPFDRDLKLAVIDYDGPHALVFPCRRVLGGWVDTKTNRRVDVRPLTGDRGIIRPALIFVNEQLGATL
jgi:hypothetical protein